jgi:hypothetical protein
MVTCRYPHPFWIWRRVVATLRGRHGLDSAAHPLRGGDPIWTLSWKIPPGRGSTRSGPAVDVGGARVSATSDPLCCGFAPAKWHPDLCSEKKKKEQDGACIAHRPAPVSALRFLTGIFAPTEVGHA